MEIGDGLTRHLILSSNRLTTASGDIADVARTEKAGKEWQDSSGRFAGA